VTPHQRAEPLPPDDRRRAIVEAITPLLLAKGAAVTSREMAEAAGIAEGTIFRVFDDKASVIVEAIRVSMDPGPVTEALARIPAADPLEAQLEEAAEALFAWTDRVATLFGVLRTIEPAKPPRPPQGRRFVVEANAAILAALADLFERHRDRLRVEPSRAALVMRGFVFATAHPMSAPEEKLSPAEIVDILLRGITKDDT
jgi:AcrR family transcriptional regulator